MVGFSRHATLEGTMHKFLEPNRCHACCNWQYYWRTNICRWSLFCRKYLFWACLCRQMSGASNAIRDKLRTYVRIFSYTYHAAILLTFPDGHWAYWRQHLILSFKPGTDCRENFNARSAARRSNGNQGKIGRTDSSFDRIVANRILKAVHTLLCQLKVPPVETKCAR